MKINTFKYFFLDAVKSLKRNVTITIASMITVAATLFIFGMFLLLMFNVNKLMSNVEASVDIRVFLAKDITITEQRDIETTLKSSEEVNSVSYESKDEALKRFSATLNDSDKELLEGYDSAHNPLPAAFIVKLKSPMSTEKVSALVKDMKGVESIGNDRELVNNIISISKALRWVGIAVFILLMGVSLFLIVNTIRMAVFSRRREIGIMKFVGATDWFIRWPFIIEGVVIGIIGAFVGNVILFIVYRLAHAKIMDFTVAIKLVEPSVVSTTMLWQFGLAGALIGSIGSVIALRKFLTV